MGCQTEIAQVIIEQKADCILAVKENQKELYQDIVSAFLFHQKTNQKPIQQKKLVVEA